MKLILAFLLFLPLLGQAPITGSINGNPIPDTTLNPPRLTLESRFVMAHGRSPTAADEQELTTTTITQYRCSQFKSLIRKAAFAATVQQFGVVVTAQDIKAAQELTHASDEPTSNENASTILAALSAVYDKHQKPDAVWTQMQLKRFFINENAWLAAVHQASTPDGRAHYESYWRTYVQVMPTFRPASSPAGWTPVAQHLALDKLIDRQLARTDPKFATYLNEYTVSKERSGGKSFSMEPGGWEYMEQQRQNYWKNQEAKVDVHLSDPSVGKACGLPQFAK